MNISCITTQQIEYYPVGVPSSVSISESVSVLFGLSWADASKREQFTHGMEECEYAYPASKLIFWEH